MTAYLVFIGVIMLLLSMDYFQKHEGYGIMMRIALLVVILFTILRHETGYDYLNYVNFVEMPLSRLVAGSLERGFVALVALIQTLNLHYFWLFFIFGISIILLLFRGIKLYTKNVRIALLIFLLIPGLFLNSFSILRQSLAIVLMFNAYYYLFEKKYKPFWGFTILAVLFHYSCILILPFFWLATKLHDKARFILIVGIPLSLFLAKLDILGMIFTIILGSSKFAAYFEMESAGTSFIKLLVLNVSVIPYLFFYNRMDKLNRSLLVMVVFGLMLTNMFASVIPITRIAYYFKIFEIVLLGNLVSYFKAGYSRMIVCSCIWMYFFAMFYSSLSNDYNNVTEYPKLTPYQTIFEKK